MSLKFKADRVGDIAIISGIIVLAICMFSVVFDIPFAEILVAFFMLLYSEMRHEYLALRKREIEEKNKENT